MTPAELLELAGHVAAALTADAAAGGGESPHVWASEQPWEHSARIVETSGTDARLWLRVETYGAQTGKLCVTGGFPDAANYSAGDTHGVDAGEIRVSPGRGATVIAREIARRLLPVYLPALVTVQGRISGRLTAASARERVAGELAATMGTTAREWRDEWTAPVPDMPHGYGDMVPNYDGESVRVDMRGVPVDLAHKLAAVIRDHAAGVEVSR